MTPTMRRVAILSVGALAMGALAIGSAAAMLACGGSSSTDLVASSDGGDAADDGPTVARGANGTIVEDGGTLATDASGGPGGSTKTLPCGTATCRVPAESCCLTDNANGTFSFGCVAGPSCPPPVAGGSAPVALGCSSSANCAPGTVCCITQENNNQGGNGSADRGSSACKSACGSQEAQLCDPKADSACPASAPCSTAKAESWELPPAFGTCGGKGP
jgi:hypothetical protein